MPINMESSSAEYADHEVQLISARLLPSADVSGGVFEPKLEFEPVSDRGLDSDELAELVGFKRMAAVRHKNTNDENSDNNGDLGFEVDLGINITESEALGTQTGDPGNPSVLTGNEIETSEITGTFDDGDQVLFNNSSEPGQLDHIQIYGSPGLASSTLGAANGFAQTKERTMFYPDKLGSGPYVDRTDDIVMLPEIEFDGYDGNPDCEITYILYWNVEEMPEGRASFARP